MPCIKVLWDIVDVAFDCYYFTALESGHMINSEITRNVHVSNVILTFAILGCLKSTVLASGYSYVMRKSIPGIEYTAIFLKPILVVIKVVMEDGVELIAEYYFVDKYITTAQPWFLIAKDVITAALYIVPIVTIIKSFGKNCTELRKRFIFTFFKKLKI